MSEQDPVVSVEVQQPEVTPAEDVVPVEEAKAVEPEPVAPVKQRLREVIDMGGGAVKCVICEKRSYVAETIMFEKLPYHRDCFLCTLCNDKLPNTIRANRFEDDIYCTTCFNKQGFATLQLAASKWVPKTGSGASTLPAGIGGGASPCTKCGLGCYPAEGTTYGGKLYHRDCMRCQDCSRLCALAEVNRFEENLYCAVCWEKGGYRHKQLSARGHTPSASISASTSVPTTPCVKCEKQCYPAEGITYGGKLYHRDCMRCQECARLCALAEVNRFEDNLFCNVCWEKGGYRHKQLSARGHVPSASISSTSVATTPCVKCEKQCYPAEGTTYGGKLYHRDCMRCVQCNHLCPLADVNRFEDNLYCGVCWEKGGFRQKQIAARAHVPTGSISSSAAAATPTTPCVKCEKQCYPAEGITYGGKLYHRDCMRCQECARLCALAEVNRFEDNLFCAVCWEKGGYRHKQLAARGHVPTQSISTAPVTNPCTKCAKQCYPAESTTYGGKVYHRDCMRCTQCNHLCPLADVNRFEENLYCGVCWEKGGFRQKQIAARAPTTSSTSTPAVVTNPCTKCAKQCYAAESTTYGGKVYHRDCMRCAMCNRTAVADGNKFEENFYCNQCWTRGDFARKQLTESKWAGESGSANAAASSTVASSSPTAASSSPTASAAEPAKSYATCRKCNGKVYPGDKAMFNDVLYHGKCLTCKNCGLRTKPDTTKAGPEGDAFCQTCATDLGY